MFFNLLRDTCLKGTFYAVPCKAVRPFIAIVFEQNLCLLNPSFSDILEIFPIHGEVESVSMTCSQLQIL